MNVEGLSLDQMRVAVTVEQTGSFAAAAKRFNRAQSAISYAVASLETQLGLPLFDRSGYRAVPTAQSALLLREMAAILARCDGLKSRATELSRGVEPLVRIVIDQLYDFSRLAPTLCAFQQQFAATRLELVSAAMEAVGSAVERDADLAILASLATVPAQMGSMTGRPLRLVPVASPKMLEAQMLTSIEGLRANAVQIVLSSPDAPPDSSYLVFGVKTWTVSELSTKLSLLVAGAGWGFMPEHMVSPELGRGELQRISVSGLPSEDHQPVFLFWKQNRELGPAGSWLRERLGEVLANS
jgi:DNA-binding transcriptional LysR family regulator